MKVALCWLLVAIVGVGVIATALLWPREAQFVVGVDPATEVEGYVMSVPYVVADTGLVVFQVGIMKNGVTDTRVDAFASRSHGLEVTDPVIVGQVAPNTESKGYRYAPYVYKAWVAKPKPK